MRLDEILNERADQAAEIVGLLQSGMVVDPEQGMIQINNHNEFVDYLQQRYQITPVGEGFYSVVHKGDGNDYVLKWSKSSDRADHDAWYKFTPVAQKSSNKLMPKILYAGSAKFKSSFMYGIMETLKIPPEDSFDNKIAKLFRRYNNDPTYGEIHMFDEAMGAVHDWLVDNEPGAPEDELEEFLMMIGTDINEMKDFLKTVTPIGDLDIHDQNIGYRPNGELVIFDPVS